jgi:predicted nucleic acid-binding Zn ribbon protein
MSKGSKFEKYSGGSDDVYPHKHCPVCNGMMSEEEEYCSPECAGINKQKGKGKKRKIILFAGIYGVVIIAFILFMIFTR